MTCLVGYNFPSEFGISSSTLPREKFLLQSPIEDCDTDYEYVGSKALITRHTKYNRFIGEILDRETLMAGCGKRSYHLTLAVMMRASCTKFDPFELPFDELSDKIGSEHYRSAEPSDHDLPTGVTH
eukprot:767950-Hanusia_phi.AAC.4